jgi:hypothetical protein
MAHSLFEHTHRPGTLRIPPRTHHHFPSQTVPHLADLSTRLLNPGEDSACVIRDSSCREADISREREALTHSIRRPLEMFIGTLASVPLTTGRPIYSVKREGNKSLITSFAKVSWHAKSFICSKAQRPGLLPQSLPVEGLRLVQGVPSHARGRPMLEEDTHQHN